MALFATETWTMRHRLLLTIGAILVVCQLILSYSANRCPKSRR